jgi:hypothetical protein
MYTNIVSSICIPIHEVQRTHMEIKVERNALTFWSYRLFNEFKSNLLEGGRVYKGADLGMSEQDQNRHPDIGDRCSLVKLGLSQKMAPPYGNRKAKNVHSTSLVERVTATLG